MDKLFSKWLLAVPALGICAALAAQDDAGSPGVVIDSDLFTLEKNVSHFIQPRIVQAELTIEADEAFSTADEAENRGELRFTGHVRITITGGLLEADSAVFSFNKDKLMRAELAGMPASFTAERTEADKEPVRGSANQIHLDNVAKTLRMSGLASITKGRVYARGCDMIYDFKNEGIANGPAECGEKFQIRVLNNQQEEAAETPPAPPP